MKTRQFFLFLDWSNRTTWYRNFDVLLKIYLNQYKKKIFITWYHVLIPWCNNCFQVKRSNLNWNKSHTKFMYIIVVHFTKNTFGRIVYADINLNPKSLTWQILKMEKKFSSPCKSNKQSNCKILCLALQLIYCFKCLA